MAPLGVARFRAEKFDLVVTDIVMQEKEGMQTICEIRELDPQARIVAISGGGRNWWPRRGAAGPGPRPC